MSPEVIMAVVVIAEEAIDGFILAEEVARVVEEERGKEEDKEETDEVVDAEGAFNAEGGAVVVEACLGTMISRMILLNFWVDTQQRHSTLL